MTWDQQRLFPTPQEQLTSDDYYTPKWIFDALGLHFDLDVASPPHPTEVQCDRYFTQEDDGLAQPWTGRVWCNPPFSKPGLWVDRWLDHGNGALITVMSKSKWFDRLWSDPNVGAVALPPTLKYIGGPIFMPCMIWAIGADNVAALHNLGRVR